MFSLIGLLILLFTLPISAQIAVQDSLLQLIKEHPQNDDRKAELLNALSFNIHNTDPKQGLAYAQEVIDFGSSLKEKRNLYGAYMTKGINLMQLAAYEEALSYYNQALKGFQALGDRENEASAFSNIGVIYKHLNVYPKALSNMQEAAHIFNEIGHPNGLYIYVNMAVIYSELKNFNKALEYYTAARQLSQKRNDRKIEAYSVFNTATLLIDQNKLEEGLAYMDTALVASNEINDKLMVARIYGNMGEAHGKLGNNAKSISLLTTALSLNDSIGNRKSRTLNLLNLGDIYFKTGKLPLAYKYGLMAYQEGKLLDIIDAQRDAAHNLSAYFERTGNADSALFYYKQYILFRDSIDNEQNRQQITRLEMQYDFDLKEQDYLKEQELSKLQLKQIWLYGLILVAFIILLAIYFIQRARIRSIRLKNELKEKELLQRAESLLMEQRISESELKAIRSQMNPHFIFNVLNSIESYILDNDPKTASILVQKFATLSRLILENSTQSMVTLDREWSALQRYVELEAIRFNHRFSYSFTYRAEQAARTLLVPPMLIQPLLENAIHHGIRHLTDYDGELQITVDNNQEKLIITITDNGIGLSRASLFAKPSLLKQQSIGIAGIKERIAIINARQKDNRASFELFDLYEYGENGTKAVITLPLVLVGQEDGIQDVNLIS